MNARKLTDGGLLIRLHDKSHLTYAKEDVSSTRVMIDGKTCNIEKENDPTKLRGVILFPSSYFFLHLSPSSPYRSLLHILPAPSPGKLVRFVIEDGEHVEANQAFAEIEVMKMYMSLSVTETGTVRFVAQPGFVIYPAFSSSFLHQFPYFYPLSWIRSVVEAGDLIAILTLDDPSRVKHAVPFDGQLPKNEKGGENEDTVNNVFKRKIFLPSPEW